MSFQRIRHRPFTSSAARIWCRRRRRRRQRQRRQPPPPPAAAAAAFLFFITAPPLLLLLFPSPSSMHSYRLRYQQVSRSTNSRSVSRLTTHSFSPAANTAAPRRAISTPRYFAAENLRCAPSLLTALQYRRQYTTEASFNFSAPPTASSVLTLQQRGGYPLRHRQRHHMTTDLPKFRRRRHHQTRRETSQEMV